jgi:hypothetical protein
MHKHTFQVERQLKAALEIGGLIVETLQFQTEQNLTHAQRNGLDMFLEHLFQKQSMLLRSAHDYNQKADVAIAELTQGVVDDLPF